MNGGYPKMDQNGRFIVENPSINRWFRGTPIFRNPHIVSCVNSGIRPWVGIFCIRLDASGLLDPRNCFIKRSSQTDITSDIFLWDSIWHILGHYIWHILILYIYTYLTCVLSDFFQAFYLACNLPDIYSTSLSVIFLAIYLRFCLASYLTYYPGQCSGQAGPRDSASWRYYSRKKRRRTRA